MAYWMLLILSFVLLIVVGIYMGIYIWKKKIKDNNMENDDLGAAIVVGCVALVAFIVFSIDLPSAIGGGQEIYVNELPTRYNYGSMVSYVVTDNKELKHLKLGNWESYEKYGNYRIRYTEPIKFVLAIEPIGIEENGEV